MAKWNEIKEKLTLVEGWARDGLTDEQISNNLGIATSTFYEYKNKYKEFSESLKKGKEIVDYEVENALLKSALEGNTTAQIFWLKNRKPKEWREKVEQQTENTQRIQIIDDTDEVDDEPNKD